MVRGRKPTPKTVRAIDGNAGHRKAVTVKSGSKELDTFPEPPLTLSAPAKKEWDRLAPWMRKHGFLTHANVGVFTAYCSWLARFMEAEEQLTREENPLVYETQSKHGSMLRVHPWLQVQDVATRHLKTLAAELGFSPTSWLRLAGAQEEDNPQSAYDEYS